MRYRLFWPAVVLLLLTACGSSESVSASEILEAYEQSETAASEKYVGRSLKITGEVLKLDYEQGRFVILGGADLKSLWCHPSSQESARSIQDLRQYDSVELRGVVVGVEESQKTRVRIDDCEVLSAVHATATP